MADRFIPVLFNLLESIFDDDLIFELRFRQSESFYESITTLRRAHIPRVTGYAEEVVPSFSEKDFLQHFRITRGMFEEILLPIADEIISRNPGGHEEIDMAQQLLKFLTYLLNQESIRELSQYFGIGQSTVHGIIKRVKKAIVIIWPDVGTRQRISQDFQLRTTLPNTVGVLDGSHIKLVACPQGGTDYINRKSFPSIQLQVVADNQLLIPDACLGWPGCTHDTRVLRNSSLFAKAEAGLLMNQDEIIIADSAYPLRQCLIAYIMEG